MADFTALVAGLNAQLAKTARFLPAAFHIHTIASHDWGRRGDPAVNARSRFTGGDGQDAFLDELVAAGLRIVCLTDHMKCREACELSSRAANRGDITVLPGMEVNCLVAPGRTERIHLLVVFPEGTTIDVIERIFADHASFPGEADRTGQEDFVVGSLADWRERIEQVAGGGLLIFAHIDQMRRGHRAHFRRSRGDTMRMFAVDPSGTRTESDISNEYADHLTAVRPHAIEVMAEADLAHYQTVVDGAGAHMSFACVARSDHHCVEGLQDSASFTYLKVSRADFRCVHDALLFHRTRVRHKGELPDVPVPRIVGVRLRSANGEGLFSDALLAFSENLSCLIGPRGSGKSTIVEALRYVLGQRFEMRPGEKGDRTFATLAEATQVANLAGTEIELIYERGDEQRVLVATFAPDRLCTTRVFTLAGESCEVEPETLPHVYPVRIFSWSELETLGRRPALQRSAIDRLSDTLPGLLAARERIRAALTENRGEIANHHERLQRLTSDNEGLLRRWREYKLEYGRLNTDEVSRLFSGVDEARGRIALIDVAARELAALEEAMASLRSQARDALSAAADMSSAPTEPKDWWEREVAPTLDFPALGAAIAARLEGLERQVRERRDILVARREAEEGQLAGQEAQLRAETHADVGAVVTRERRERARENIDRANRARAAYLETLSSVRDLLAAREGLLADLDAAVVAVSIARAANADAMNERLREIGDREKLVQINVRMAQDREALTAYLDGKFLNVARAGHYHEQGVAERLARKDPVVIAKAILDRDPTGLVANESSEGLSIAEAAKLVEAIEPWGHDPGGDVACTTDELLELLELQEQPIDDQVEIVSGDEPVEDLSPGGRSSAMLPVIALADSAPLVIDQPEDNLDNRMVGQTLSRILAELKERRQIIVTTHNPNIVVGGDAEQVAVLEPMGARAAKIDSTGSIDDDGIIDAVIKIMEGGAEAFSERRRRYGARLSG